MPQPTINQVHVNRPLTNLSVAYMQSADNFIASKVFPVVPVDKKSDVFWVFTKNDWLRDEAELRAPSTESAGSGYNVGTQTYNCDVFAIHKDVSDMIRANSDTSLADDRPATEFVTQRLLLRQEVQLVTDFFKTGVWGTDVTGATDFAQWDDYTTSDPLENVDAGKEAIISVTGKEANTLVLGYSLYRKLIRHPLIREQVKYTSAENISEALLAKILDVKRVFVSKAIKATNVEGETASYSFVFGKSAWLGHVAESPGLLTPSAGYTIAWKGASYGMGQTVGIKKFRLEAIESDRIEGQIAIDHQIVGADLGYFFASAVA
jgi:hypothetical protein